MERYPYCCTVQKTFLLTIWSSLSLPFFFGRIIFERMGFLLLLKPWFDRPHCIQKRRERRSEFAAVPTVKKKKKVRWADRKITPPAILPPLRWREGAGRLRPFFLSLFPSSLQFSSAADARKQKSRPQLQGKNSRKYPNVVLISLLQARAPCVTFLQNAAPQKRYHFPWACVMRHMFCSREIVTTFAQENFKTRMTSFHSCCASGRRASSRSHQRRTNKRRGSPRLQHRRPQKGRRSGGHGTETTVL